VLANDHISIDAQLGEVVALVGPNGAGKTTFVLQVLGLLAPTSGSIRVDNIDVVRNPHGVKRLASYQPQHHTALGGLTVHHALIYTARLRGLATSDARRQAADLTAQLGLESILATPLNQLSGGWRRLVDVTLALTGHPKLIVFDEPTNDLDPMHRQRVWDCINTLRLSRGLTCLLVTHNLLEAERVVDRVVVVQQGRVVAAGSPGELKERLGDALRLDVYLRDSSGSALLPRELAELAHVRTIRGTHVQFVVPGCAVSRALDLLLTERTRALVDDFRLAPPSLEDVYLQIEEDRDACARA
jgi:ABC-type multidrug transport system ATPase subunit